MRGAVFTRGEIGRLQASMAAAELGVDPRQVSRWVAAGVSVQLADVLACRVCGVHPVVLWADWFDGLLDECEGVEA